MNPIKILDGLKSCDISELQKVNYMLLPITLVDQKRYNDIVNWLSQQDFMSRGIKRTASGGISIAHGGQNNVWESTPRLTENGNCMGAEIVILLCHYFDDLNDFAYFGGRIQLGRYKGDECEKHISGRYAFLDFKRLLSERGINIEDKMVTPQEGREIKKKIPKPYICLFYGAKENKTYDHVYHYDRNSAYGAGMKEYCPEWGDLIQHLYDNRKRNSKYKDILNMAIGFFQSSYLQYRLSNVSEHCIRRNNEELENKAIELIGLGCKIIAFNTDGIWFVKPDNLELESSSELGGWKLDHRDCQIRFKSPGAYEFIEDGIYTPVVRGITKMDGEKPRTEWQWGDIYCEGAKRVAYNFCEDGTLEEINVDL